MLRNVMFTDWFTVLIVVCLIFIAAAKLLFAKRFKDLFEILGNSNYLKIYLKDQKFINTFDGLLFTNLIISLIIFILISLNVLDNVNHSKNFELYYTLVLIIGSIIIIKVLIDRLIGNLFDIGELMNVYVFQKITFKNYLGLILLPINILLIFVINPSKLIIYIAICLLFIVNLIGFVMSIKNHLKPIKGNFFYFILYLCALEIAPYFILYKVFNSN